MSSIAECLFCGSKDYDFLFSGSDRIFEIEGSFNVNRCRNCRLLFLNPQPSPEQIAAHYPLSYYSFEGERPDLARDERLYKDFYGGNTSIFKRILCLPYLLILRTLVGGSGKRILDVGCGSGHFLSIARKIFDMEAFGVEPYSYDHSFAERNKLNIYSGTLEDANFPDSHFDFITLNHVFEHLGDPRSTLGELKRILKPGGTLVIGVPQSRSIFYWIFRKYWMPLDVPRHFFVPSTKNLKKVAIAAGFKVKGVRYNSSPSSILGTLFYWRNSLLGRKAYLHQFTERRLAVRALLPVSYLLNILKLGDQIEIFLTV